MDKMNYTYIVQCSDGTLYTGWTTDVERRVRTHNSGKGAKYRPVTTRPTPPNRRPCAAKDQTADKGREKEADCKDTMTATKTAAALKNKCCGSFYAATKEYIYHDEEMEDLVGTEVLVAGVEDGQGVDNAAYGIDDASGEEPAKGCRA